MYDQLYCIPAFESQSDGSKPLFQTTASCYNKTVYDTYLTNLTEMVENMN